MSTKKPQPDFEDATIEHAVSRIIHAAVGKWAMRVLITLAISAFGFGAWMTNMSHAIADITKTLAATAAATEARVSEWGDWRRAMDAWRIRVDSDLSKAGDRRWNSDHQRIYSHQLGRDNPMLKVPDPDEIKNKIQ